MLAFQAKRSWLLKCVESAFKQVSSGGSVPVKQTCCLLRCPATYYT